MTPIARSGVLDIESESTDLASCLFDICTDPLLLIEPESGKILRANAAAETQTGRDVGLLTTLCVDDLFDASAIEPDFSGRLNLRSTAGNHIECQVSCQRVSVSGADCGLMKFSRVASREVASTETDSPPSNDAAHLRNLLNDIGVIIWEAELPFNGITYISHQLTNILGFSVDEWQSDPKAWEMSIIPEDRERAVGICAIRTAQGEDHTIEYRVKAADGRIVWIEDRIRVFVDQYGRPSRARGVMLDITEAKRAQEMIRFQREQYQLLVDNAPVCIHRIDESQELASINPKGLELVGAKSLDDVIGTKYLQFVVDRDRKRLGKLLHQAFRGKPSLFQFECHTAHGIRTFKSNYIPVRDSDGLVRNVIGTSEDITEANKVLEKLHVQERAIESADLGILIASVSKPEPKGDQEDDDCSQEDVLRLVHCNPAFQQITGFDQSFLVGSDGADLVIDDSGLTLAKLLRATMCSDQSKSVINRIDLRTGRVRHCEVSVSMVVDEHNSLSHLVCFWNDITDRVVLETKMRESEHLFRTLSEQAPNGVMLFDVNGGVSYLNAASEAILGASASDCLVFDWYERIHQEDRQMVADAFQRLLWNGEAVSLETRFVHAAGATENCNCHDGDNEQESDGCTEVWGELCTQARISDDGQVVGYVGSLVDITQRKKTLSQLAENERRYRNLVQNAPDAIMVYDSHRDCFVDWNDNALAMFGYSEQRFQELGLSELLPEFQPDGRNSLEAARAYLEQASEEGTVAFECSHQNAAGQVFPCEVRLVKHDELNPNLIRTSLTDVTRQRAANDKLQRIRLALERTSDAMYVIDPQGQILDVNQATCESLGYSREELLTMNVTDIKHGFDPEKWPELWASVKSAKNFTAESTHRCKDGSLIPVEVSASYSNFGQEFVVALARDITERNESYERMRERETLLAHVSRQSTMGELVAGIAHEVNQPLYSIVNFAKAATIRLQRMDEQHPDGDVLVDIARWNKQISEAAGHAGDIIHRMRNFVAQESEQSVPANVDNAIMDAAELLAYQLRRADVTLTTNLGAADTIVVLDRIRIQQIVVNLVINAIEAIEQHHSPRREVVVETSVSGSDVRVGVFDSGPGFPAEAGKNLFEAFVTTKEKAMGMGLAVVHTIIDSYDGGLTVSESQTGGAAIVFTIPIDGGAKNV